jgi:hypothetical protein
MLSNKISVHCETFLWDRENLVRTSGGPFLWLSPFLWAVTSSFVLFPQDCQLMVSRTERESLSKLTYIPLLVLIVCLIGVSGVFLLSQAVRTAPDRQWTQNGNVFVIGASYLALVSGLWGSQRVILLRVITACGHNILPPQA